MTTDCKHRRLLLAVRAPEQEAFTAYLRAGALPRWELVPAKTLGEARFKLRHTTCDVLLLDESLCRVEGDEAWAWLAGLKTCGVIVLAGSEAETQARAYAHGAALCLSHAALANLPLLRAALRRAAEYADLLHDQVRLQTDAEQSRHQVDELVGRLWQTFPGDLPGRWYTPRHTLERLEEEVDRSARHGCALTVAVAELQGCADSGDSLTAWTSEQVALGKRRTDIAGHYGLRLFLLLLPHTPRRGAWVCCRRLQQSLETATPPSEGGPVRAYFGIATYSPETRTAQALLRVAEENLAVARSESQGRVVGGPEDPEPA
jgi:PleD family two-component response regulator